MRYTPMGYTLLRYMPVRCTPARSKVCACEVHVSKVQLACECV